MQISNRPQQHINFQAKFLHSEDLKRTVEFALEHNKFEKLNQARKNIDSAWLTTRLLLNVEQAPDGRAIVRFSKFRPNYNVDTPTLIENYKLVKTTEYISDKPKNALRYAMEKIIKLGNNAPHNKMYEKIVMSNK